MNPRIKAWLEIIRLPNVLSAPGDPLAGMLLASIGAAVIPWRSGLILCAASVCFYMAGMIFNDLRDIKEDTRDRPSRPIPSGRISSMAALNAGGLLSVAGLVLCLLVWKGSFVIGALLLLLILAYDFLLKDVPIFGPLSMGLCRGVSMLLGVSAVISTIYFGADTAVAAREAVTAAVTKDAVHVAFFTVTIYVAMVTMLARYETTTRNPGILRWYPLVTLVVGLMGLIWVMSREHGVSGTSVVFMLLSCISMFLAFDAGRCIRVRGMVKPAMIGQFLAVLLLLQAAFIFLASRGTPTSVWWVGLIVLLCWPVNRGLRRWIAAS